MFLGAVAIILCVVLFFKLGNLENELFVVKKRLAELKNALPSSAPQTKEQNSSAPETAPAAAPQEPAPVFSAPEETAPAPVVAEPPAAAVCRASVSADVSSAGQPGPGADTCAQEKAPCPPAPALSVEEDTAEPAQPVPQPAAPEFPLVKVLSWAGGFILFLAAGFWIKYALENNLLSPSVRIAVSAGVGLLLLAAGLFIRKEHLKTTSDTLCGVGLTVLYISVYGAHVFYHMLGFAAAFSLMAGVAVLSFAVAVWKQAKYVGFLAEVISFITLFLLSFGTWNMSFFLAYMACINVAAAAAALARRWDGLLIGAAVFTFLGQLAACVAGGLRADTASFCLFSFLYAAAAAFSAWKFEGKLERYTQNVLGGFIAGNMLFVLAGVLMPGQTFRNSLLLLALGMGLNLALVYLTCRDKGMHTASWRVGKTLVFLSLWGWTQHFQILIEPWFVLGVFLAFAAANGGADLFLYKRQARQPGWWAILFPVLLMLPVSGQISSGGLACVVLLLAVLLVLSLLFALTARRPLAGLFAVVLFLAAAVNLRPETSLSAILEVGLFALGLVPVLCLVAMLRWGFPEQFERGRWAVFISALMPYLLALTLADQRQAHLPMLLGFAGVLNLLCLWLAYLYKSGKMLPAACAGSFLLQAVGFVLMKADFSGAFIGWVLVLGALFALFPLVFKRRFFEDTSAWATAALAGAGAFLFIAFTLRRYYEVDYSLVAVCFALLYGAYTYVVYFWQPLEEGIQRARMAWLGGVTLLFVTAFFPMYFDKQWVSLSWALEGAALVWLNRWVKYRGAKLTGFCLLLTSFFLVFAATPLVWNGEPTVFNRFLYVFGIVGACLLYAAWRWEPAEETAYPSWLSALGGIVFFVLLNVEIAVFFTAEPGTLQFDMFGSFQSAIIYTLGWTFFGGICLFLGFGKPHSYTAKTGLCLICLSLFKLFFSDIWALGGLYRVLGLAGIALVLIGISFLFQMLYKKS